MYWLKTFNHLPMYKNFFETYKDLREFLHQMLDKRPSSMPKWNLKEYFSHSITLIKIDTERCPLYEDIYLIKTSWNWEECKKRLYGDPNDYEE